MAKTKFGPRNRLPRVPQGTQLIMQLEHYQNSFDKEAFNKLIQSQGVLVEHYRAIPDPRGMYDRGDAHPIVSGIPRSSDGFIYKKAGEMHAFFSANSDQWTLQTEGNIQHAMAVMTLPELYEDPNNKLPILVSPYDRFYIKDIEVRVINLQFIEAHPTGVDILQFPATCVEELVDSDGIFYKEGEHFKLDENGNIVWISSHRPGMSIDNNRGKVYAVRYRYVPFFVVARLLHEIRVSQVTDTSTLQRKVERMPYQVLVLREYIFSDVANDPNQKIIDRRHQMQPPMGGVVIPNPSGRLGPKT